MANAILRVDDPGSPRRPGAILPTSGRVTTRLERVSRAIGRAPESSVIAAGTVIVGALDGRGDVEIYGQVIGDVTGREVVIAQGAVIEGSVVADTLDVLGTVNGPVTAKVAAIRAGARVIGKITHHDLTIEPGAVAQGLRPWQPAQFFTG